jgi:farnesyl diphosphate synthase
MTQKYKFLNNINFPSDLRKLSENDLEKGKATLISLLGYENAVKYCDKIIFDINKSLKKYGSNSKNIRETLDYILNRDK